MINVHKLTVNLCNRYIRMILVIYLKPCPLALVILVATKMSTKIERGRGLKKNSTDYNDIYNKLLYKDLNIDVSPESARKSSKYIEKYTKDAWYSCFVSLRNLVETQLFAQELGE